VTTATMGDQLSVSCIASPQTLLEPIVLPDESLEDSVNLPTEIIEDLQTISADLAQTPEAEELGPDLYFWCFCRFLPRISPRSKRSAQD
jgi:hypothetical protein